MDKKGQVKAHICTEQIIPDNGRIIWQSQVLIGYLDQYAEIQKSLTMRSFLKSAFSRLYQIENEMTQLYEKAARGHTECLDLAARYQERLEIHDFYSIETQIKQVANGLGLLAIGLERLIEHMSGGQRAKVIMSSENITEDTTTTAPAKDATVLVKEIGRTTYIVRIHFSKTSRKP